MKLAEIKKGQNFRIIQIPDEIIRAQTIRFGISEGSEATCVQVIPAGPIIVKKNRHEIAIGRALANSIEIEATPKQKRIFVPNEKLGLAGER